MSVRGAAVITPVGGWSLGASTIVSGRMMAPMLMAAVTGPVRDVGDHGGAEGEAAVAEEGRVVAERQA